MRVLDLFSGIGAFSLGLERSGMRTISFCEIDPFCRRVLAKHWPEVHCYHDVRELSAQHLTADGYSDIDVICGGFPCQDISIAGKGAGISGERSGLWREFSRLIGEIRPRYAIVENVSALLHRGLGDVLGDLASLGYDAEWHCIPASAVGAPHRRDRIWIVAYAQSKRSGEAWRLQRDGYSQRTASGGEARDNLAHSKSDGWSQGQPQLDAGGDQARGEWPRQSGGVCAGVANADSAGLSDGRQAREQARSREAIWRMALAESERRSSAWWNIEPDVGRVAHGVASRVDRLRGLGNALVPQIPEMIGRAIMAVESQRAT